MPRPPASTVSALLLPGAAGLAVTAGLGVAAGVVLALVLTTGAPDQATIGIVEDELVVRPLGAMRVWALSRGVSVPVSAVADIGVADRRAVPLGLRAPGAYLPGVVCAGTYRRRGSKSLWMVGRTSRVLVIDFVDQSYDRVVVQVAEPEAAAIALRRALLG